VIKIVFIFSLNVFKYLEKIGNIYFNISTKTADQDNPFNNILRMIIGSDNADTNTTGNVFFNAKDINSFMDLDDNEDLD
jgi:hypothetical protein